MPTAPEILAALESIAQRGIVIAGVWHVVIGAWVVAASQSWRPSPRLAGVLLVLPLVSVSIASWVFGQVFNAAIFTGLTGVLAVIAARSSLAEVRRQTWTAGLGALLLMFAWVYPHFLEGHSTFTYLIASPMGLLPCPTLSLVIGWSLLGYGPTSRGWSLTLAGAGVFYGLFGAVQLGVWIDLVLVVGAMALAARGLVHLRVAERRSLELIERVAPSRSDQAVLTGRARADLRA